MTTLNPPPCGSFSLIALYDSFALITPDWLFGKQMLLPLGQAWIDTSTRQVFVLGLTWEQVKALPACTAATILDADYEAQVSHIYHRLSQRRQTAGRAGGVDGVEPRYGQKSAR